MNKKLEQIAIAVITILISVVGFFAIRTLNQVDNSILGATTSIEKLNTTVGGVVAEMGAQRIIIDLHTDQIKELQKAQKDLQQQIDRKLPYRR